MPSPFISSKDSGGKVRRVLAFPFLQSGWLAQRANSCAVTEGHSISHRQSHQPAHCCSFSSPSTFRAFVTKLLVANYHRNFSAWRCQEPQWSAVVWKRCGPEFRLPVLLQFSHIFISEPLTMQHQYWVKVLLLLVFISLSFLLRVQGEQLTCWLTCYLPILLAFFSDPVLSSSVSSPMWLFAVQNIWLRTGKQPVGEKRSNTRYTEMA